jgi:hypothetical protein
MFTFELPKHAAIKVELPTGGDAIMIHLGDGRFGSNMPPLVLAGVSVVADTEVTGLQVGWDSGALPPDVYSAIFAFDVAGAAAAVESAAAAGDVKAVEVVGKMREAEQMLAAQIAVGMVKDPEAAADAQDAS